MTAPVVPESVVLWAGGIVAGYEPDLPILNGVGFELRAKEIVALLGPNGAGKLTLIKAVAGLVPISSGSVRLGDQEITRLPPHLLIRRGLGFVPQTENVFAAMSIDDNLLLAAAILPKPRRAARVAAMYAMFPALAARKSLAAGRLSGGQRQMLAIARALLVEPQVLMLDEPSAGLSPKVAADVFETLKQVRESGVAILLVEQSVRAALTLADRAYVLAEGRNRHDGPAAVLRDDPIIAHLYFGGDPVLPAGPAPGVEIMNLQFIADGLLIGAMVGLGAIGVTLTYSILGFANFVHGEFIAWGAYAAFVFAGLIGLGVGMDLAPIGPFSIGWAVLIAGVFAMGFTGGLALALDWLLFSRLRRHGNAIVLVMASFGASLALRALLEFLFTAEPQYFSRELQIATPIGLGIRVTPDQMLMLVLTLVLVVGMHLLITRTTIGRAMRAVSENPNLAAVAGIDVAGVIRKTWLIGGALACASGIVAGITVQIRPHMGFDLLLPMFAAAILGGIGSVPGAVIGGLIVGLAESMAVQFVGAEYRAAVAFLLLIAVLLVRPAGLFGKREA